MTYNKIISDGIISPGGRRILNIDINTIAFLSGFILIVPSNILTIFISIFAMTFAFGNFISNNGRSFLISLTSLLIAALLCAPGVIIGNSEALQFIIRMIACFFAFCFIFIVAPRGDLDFLRNFLTGLVISALINSLFVNITALFPDIYDYIGIRNLTGFDKNMRFLRSPGLFRGFDVSGYFMIFAICAIPLTNLFSKDRPYISSLSLLSLSMAIFFSSRSSMMLFTLNLFFISFIYRNSVKFFHRVVFVIFAIISIMAALVLGSGVLQTDFFPQAREIFSSYFGFDFDQVYATDSAAYQSHYIMDKIQFLPYRNEITPDNFYIRCILSVGIVGFIGIMTHIIIMMASSISSYNGNNRSFSILFSILFIAGSAKNNYMLFLPFYMILVTIYACRPLNKNQ